MNHIRQAVAGGEDGQSMIEYALIAVLAAIVCIVVVTAIGQGLIHNFQTVANAL